MPYIHKIFEKATIRSIADYLLFGLGPDKDTRDYEERLDELYNKFEEAVRKYDSNPTSELLDLSNELTSETASVYTEIGLQLGMLLCLDMANNCRWTEEFPDRIAGKEKEARKHLENRVLMGNVSTYALEFGDPARVKMLTRSCIKNGSDIISPACGLGMKSPIENIQAILECLNEEDGQNGRD